MDLLTKNGGGRRMPMFGPMSECLRMQKSIRNAKFPDCRYVFFGETGGRIVDFREAWKSACKEAGVNEDLLVHDLRRLAARNMRRAGVPETTILKIAGWKTPAMFRRYDIQDGRDLQRAAEIMEQRLAEQRESGTVSSTITPAARTSGKLERAGKRLN
jgi:hypothetical protein